MARKLKPPFWEIANRQGAYALLAATVAFLRTNNIPKRLVLDSVRGIYENKGQKPNLRQYRKIVNAYEDMGTVMSTWFSLPKFLDSECRPLPLSGGFGPQSVGGLVRASRVSISTRAAVELMRQSPSVKVDALGFLTALRREFVLPNFEIPRAALVMERYLDTLHRNFSPRNKRGVLLLERNCHVPKVDMACIAPVLRDIKRRGAAYIESVNGDIEELRIKRSRPKGTGEMSVHIFAWTRLSRIRKSRRFVAGSSGRFVDKD